ncbi:uncharacterized protein EDB91DRAFT_475183 [Suillus paluster]|uniref:uncharacterized protein n=1 Tax=Suillus paluster TaxID=48578 RepID=UPI001B88644E|nr:uncharacterized protein EDB91DRAFT_475183 [Suillus paluster]KAG1719310.1 hypothetical protein EDB91DRAFT_475183 [Suillus paluster]
MSPGMAWMPSSDHQPDIDIITPMILGDKCLGRPVMSATFIQVRIRRKNARAHSRFVGSRPDITPTTNLGYPESMECYHRSRESPLAQHSKYLILIDCFIDGCSSNVCGVIEPDEKNLFAGFLGLMGMLINKTQNLTTSGNHKFKSKVSWCARII